MSTPPMTASERAKVALWLSCLSLVCTFVASMVVAMTARDGRVALARETHLNQAYVCEQVDQLKSITRQALQAAIERARASLDDPAAAASIVELRREIALLQKPCTPR